MADALAQVPGFPDVNDRPEAVTHQVNAWLMRKRRKFFADVVGHWHATTNLQVRCVAWQGT